MNSVKLEYEYGLDKGYNGKSPSDMYNFTEDLKIKFNSNLSNFTQTVYTVIYKVTKDDKLIITAVDREGDTILVSDVTYNNILKLIGKETKETGEPIEEEETIENIASFIGEIPFITIVLSNIKDKLTTEYNAKVAFIMEAINNPSLTKYYNRVGWSNNTYSAPCIFYKKNHKWYSNIGIQIPKYDMESMYEIILSNGKYYKLNKEANNKIKNCKGDIKDLHWIRESLHNV
jgi:hypothetical protein